MVKADLDDVVALKSTFKGSNVIFGVTDFWQQMALPASARKANETRRTINVIAYDAEIPRNGAMARSLGTTILRENGEVSSISRTSTLIFFERHRSFNPAFFIT